MDQNVDFRVSGLPKVSKAGVAVGKSLGILNIIEYVLNTIFVNTKILQRNLTGVQRYLLELLARFGAEMEAVSPAVCGASIGGHIWEQAVLPIRCSGGLLWSPSNSGPVLYSNQVVTVHDMVPLDHPEWLSPAFGYFYQLLLPQLIRRVRRVIAISEFTRSRILAHVPSVEDRVTVVPNGVDGRFHRRSSSEVSMVLRELGAPSDSYFLSVGSLEPRKNIPRLLEAWKKALPYLAPDVWLLLTGARGIERVFGRTDLSLPDRVHLTGYVRDEWLPALYSGAKSFCYLSLYEGFGLPPLEAMSCGAPSITSNCASIPEVVGDAAITVNPLDVDEIARAIVNLDREEGVRETLSRRGVDRAGSFTWDKTSEMTLKILMEEAARK